MAIKHLDPEDMYIVREMFGCGHGHVIPPGFTHWESGEACVFGHDQSSGDGYGPGPTDNASYHYYWRLMCVSIVDANGADMWEKLCSDPNKFGHFPLAPPGLKEGQVIGDMIKVKRGVDLKPEIIKKYNLGRTKVIWYDPPPREALTTPDAAA